MREASIKKWLGVVLPVIALLDIYFFYQAIILGHRVIYDEFQIMENLQAIFLVGSFLIFLYAFFKAEASEKAVVFTGMLLWLTMFLREVDFEEVNVPELIKWFLAGKVKDSILAVVWVVTLGYLLKHRARTLSYVKSIVFSEVGMVVFTGGVLLVIGAIFEKLHFPQHDFYEELSELNGYIFIFLGSLLFPGLLDRLRKSKRKEIS